MDKEQIREMRQSIKKNDLDSIKSLLNNNEGLLRL